MGLEATLEILLFVEKIAKISKYDVLTKRPLRSAFKGQFCKPEKYKNIYSRRRLGQFAKDYNNLSREMREANIIEFSKHLKTILFEDYTLTL